MNRISTIAAECLLLITTSAAFSQTPSAPSSDFDNSDASSQLAPLDPSPEPGPTPPERPLFDPFPTALGNGAGGYSGLMGGFGGAGGLGGTGIAAPRINYAAVWYPDQPVRGQNTDLGMVRQELSLASPIWRDGPDALVVNVHVRSVLFNTDAVLPDSGRDFPNSLWNIGMGLTYTHAFQNGWTAGAMVNVGSASDQPFSTWNEVNVGVGGFVRIPVGERNAWMIGAMYSPLGELPFPIPMVAFLWRPTEEFSMNIGLPFSIRWRPTEDLLLECSYVPIRTVHARATYRLAEGIGIYGGYDWSNEAYFLADREDVKERFFYYEQKVSAGVRFNLGEHAALDFSAGYAFDRFFFTGRQWSDNSHDRVNVGNGAFLGARFQWRF
jgi:hypothetical protein